jgi:hypothetical protein
MRRFFELTFKPFFVVTGAGTAVAALDAFAPQWTVETVQKLAWAPEYGLFVQHWGIMVGAMGVAMIVAAFRASWRAPILLYAAVEKAFMVWLYLTHAGAPYAHGFLLPAAMDALVVLYVVGWLAVGGAREGQVAVGAA